MRTMMLLLVVGACGDVKATAADARPDTGPTDTMPPDACSPMVTERSQPMWLLQGGFAPVLDPAGSGAMVWKFVGHAPSGVSITVPVKSGDRITGVSFDAYGDGSPTGLQGIEVVYQPGDQILAQGKDVGRGPMWGKFTFADFKPTMIADGGSVTLQFTAYELDYYIGLVTATFLHQCGS